MIQWLENLFHTVVNFFSSISGLIAGVVEKLKEFFGFISAAFEFVTGAIALIPNYYIAFGVIIITVLVVFLFVGREPGGD